jgi:hypothetical protein
MASPARLAPALALALALPLFACGGDGPSGADPTDGPPPGTPLLDRLSVATVTTPAGVAGGDTSWRIWGRGDLEVAPVFTVPTADCGALIGYTTGGAAPTARVTRVDAADRAVATYDLGRFTLRGLAAEDDGHFAALLWDDTVSPAALHVARFDPSGAPGWTAPLVDALAAPTDFGIGDSRLEYGDGRYGAYYHVHGISGFANGHEGDQLKWIAADTGTVTNGWSWGCSHSMSALLRYLPSARRFLPACVTDCFPGTSGDFAANSIGGVYLNHDDRKVVDVEAGCNGSVAGELGSAAIAPDGWKLVWNSHQSPAGRGQSSYGGADNQDVGFAAIAADLTPGPVVWLTTSAGDERNPTIARWQPDGEAAERYLVGWVEPGSPERHVLAVVDPAGAITAAPIAIPAAWGERDDPFRVHASGDVTWAWFDGAGQTELHLARVRAGRTCP